METIRPLVVVTNDQDLLAIVPWIKGEVSRASAPREADVLLGGYRGMAVLAFGWDALNDAAHDNIPLPNYPFLLLYTADNLAEQKFFGPTTIRPENTFVLPHELDFLHTRLGQYKPAQKNGVKL